MGGWGAGSGNEMASVQALSAVPLSMNLTLTHPMEKGATAKVAEENRASGLVIWLRTGMSALRFRGARVHVKVLALTPALSHPMGEGEAATVWEKNRVCRLVALLRPRTAAVRFSRC